MRRLAVLALVPAMLGCGQSVSHSALGAVLSGCGGGRAPASPTPSPAPVVPLQEKGSVIFRVNQVGYLAGCPKVVFAMARSGSASRVFSVVDSGRVVMRGTSSVPERWNAQYVVYRLDLSRLTAAGVYRVRFAGHTSPPVRVGAASAMYAPLAADAIAVFQSQRDGPNVIPGPMDRRPAHLLDASAGVYGIPRYDANNNLLGTLAPTGATVDASGGWFDAGDYLKFITTASFADSVLLFTARQFPAGVPDMPALLAETRQGTDWLEKMWDRQTGVLYFQVGIGDGNGNTILGDHDIWRLPQTDDGAAVSPSDPEHYARHRPVFAANAPGQPISPNLAGGTAAAFALCAQVFATSDPSYARQCLLDGQTLYAHADTAPHGQLLTSAPLAYYSQPDWRADMWFASVELYLATSQLGSQGGGLPGPSYYLYQAGPYANAYMEESTTGEESLSLDDVSTLASFDLVRVLQTPAGAAAVASKHLYTNIPTLMSDRHDQLALASRLAARNPFGEGNPATNEDTVAHAFGYVTQAALYDTLARRSAFEGFGQEQLGWALGANAWGSSFMVGAGSVFPHCLSSQIANLSGSLNGQGAVLAGAAVEGPTDPESVGGLSSLGPPQRACSVPSFAAMDGHGFAYRDDVRSFASSEPTDDITALALLAAAQEAARG
jgi:hypothetical protein